VIAKLRSLRLTQRQAFAFLAIILALALIALLIYLLWLLSRGGFTSGGGAVVEGLRPIYVIDGPGEGEKPKFDRPMGVAYGKDGRIYVSDTDNNRVCVFNGRGQFLFEFGEFGVAKPLPGGEMSWVEGRMNFPLGIDVDDEGNIYVADFRNDQIQVFDREGIFLRRFPDPMQVVGKGASGQDGTGIAVTDVAVWDGKVYALDSYQVVVFTADGEFYAQFGKPGSGPGDLDRPNGIDVADDGTIYVSDSNHNRVTAFDQTGEVLWTLGEPIGEMAAEVEYVFGLPRGITVMSDGSILVVDAFEHTLSEATAQGDFVRRYGRRGTQPAEFNFPNAVDDNDDRIVVADKENNRVQVLELLK